MFTELLIKDIESEFNGLIKTLGNEKRLKIEDEFYYYLFKMKMDLSLGDYVRKSTVSSNEKDDFHIGQVIQTIYNISNNDQGLLPSESLISYFKQKIEKEKTTDPNKNNEDKDYTVRYMKELEACHSFNYGIINILHDTYVKISTLIFEAIKSK